MIKKIIILFVLIILTTPFFSQIYFENRKDIPEKYTWDMTILFDGWNHWEDNYKETEKLIETFVIRDTFKTANELYETLCSLDTISNRIEKLSMYSSMLLSVKQTNEFASKKRYKAMILDNKLHYKTAWIAPCMQKLNPDSVYQWIMDFPKLKDYEFRYRSELRDKKHVIPAEKEQTISRFDFAFYAFDDAYDALINLDNKVPEIKLGDSVISLNSTKYFDILRNEKNRELRSKAYQKMNRNIIQTKIRLQIYLPVLHICNMPMLNLTTLTALWNITLITTASQQNYILT
jgi:oligoendopeptidase F